ncbi:diguanylate cyclase [Acetobacterium sp.]|uniref:sensor domain-containing diguanylate cyclase n=1 Tax=Acetobacterium sp. TaxID=1872094 RepID=UPI0035934989
MLSNDAKAMLNYINAILTNKILNNDIPEIAEGDADFLELEQSLRTIKNWEKMRQDNEERHRLMTENACDIIATVDLSGNFTYISPSVEKITGYTPDEVKNHYREIGYFLPGVQKEMDRQRVRIKEMVAKGERFDAINFEQRQVRKDGESIYTDTVLSGIYDEQNNFRELLAISRDITEKVKIRKKIIALAETDNLTKLYNRVKLDYTLELEFCRAKTKAATFGLIMIDIDDFKQINDHFGHLAGDLVLYELAKLFKAIIRSADLIGRWGGEEFMVILPETDARGAMALAEKIRQRVSEQHFLERERITISLGVTVFRDDATVYSIIYRADQALYQAKKNGKNQVYLM